MQVDPPIESVSHVCLRCGRLTTVDEKRVSTVIGTRLQYEHAPGPCPIERIKELNLKVIQGKREQAAKMRVGQ